MISNMLSISGYVPQKAHAPSSGNTTPSQSEFAALRTQTPDSFQATTPTGKSPQFQGKRDDFRKQTMARHLQEGFNLIKKGQYEQATRHFQNKKTLKAMDVGLEWGPFTFHPQIPVNANEAKKLIKTVAKQNMAFDKNGDLSIKFANIGLGDFTSDEPIQPQNDSESAILEHIRHEEALMAAEENIHTYQNMNGGREITYTPKPGKATDEDHEIDIATTLEKYEVPVTYDFLQRYRSRADHVIMPEVWDLVTDANGEVSRKNVSAEFRPALLNLSTSRPRNIRQGIITGR